jgi:hypothetical protein
MSAFWLVSAKSVARWLCLSRKRKRIEGEVALVPPLLAGEGPGVRINLEERARFRSDML